MSQVIASAVVSWKSWTWSSPSGQPPSLGTRIEFTTLPTGDVIVEEQQGDGDLSPLADVIEKKLDPPYRAFAARQTGDV